MLELWSSHVSISSWFFSPLIRPISFPFWKRICPGSSWTRYFRVSSFSTSQFTLTTLSERRNSRQFPWASMLLCGRESSGAPKTQRVRILDKKGPLFQNCLGWHSKAETQGSSPCPIQYRVSSGTRYWSWFKLRFFRFFSSVTVPVRHAAGIRIHSGWKPHPGKNPGLQQNPNNNKNDNPPVHQCFLSKLKFRTDL